jgi:hypothetical protein
MFFSTSRLARENYLGGRKIFESRQPLKGKCELVLSVVKYLKGKVFIITTNEGVGSLFIRSFVGR